MKIVIISSFSITQNTPRAFRARSLYETFEREGHEVLLITAQSEYSISTPTTQIANDTFIIKKLRTTISKLLSLSVPDGKNFFRSVKLWRKFDHKGVDLTISIGLPFSVHFMTALAVKKGRLQTKKLIADYGDPYSNNPSSVKPFYAKAMERWTLTFFDKVTVPTANAISAYESVCGLEKMKVIPQGYNINQDFATNYKNNEIPSFCFAGNLYKKIRNPKKFLDHLANVKNEFRFHIYTDFQNTETMEILGEYQIKLNNRLVLHSQIPRHQCIETMSKMDFLINFSNQSTTQTPSKIIDYTLSSRPFVSISQDQSSFEEFEKFLIGDFSSFIKPDISAFDENKISRQFLQICSE